MLRSKDLNLDRKGICHDDQYCRPLPYLFVLTHSAECTAKYFITQDHLVEGIWNRGGIITLPSHHTTTSEFAGFYHCAKSGHLSSSRDLAYYKSKYEPMLRVEVVMHGSTIAVYCLPNLLFWKIWRSLKYRQRQRLVPGF